MWTNTTHIRTQFQFDRNNTIYQISIKSGIPLESYSVSGEQRTRSGQLHIPSHGFRPKSPMDHYFVGAHFGHMLSIIASLCSHKARVSPQITKKNFLRARKGSTTQSTQVNGHKHRDSERHSRACRSL